MYKLNYLVTFLRSFFIKGSFAQGVSVFTTGTFLAYVIGFVFTPVITRIYLPSDYGQFAFFNTLLAISVAISCLGYNHALIIPRKNAKFLELSRIVLGIAFFTSLLLLIMLWITRSWVLAYFHMSELRNWVLILPALVLLTSMQQIADSYNIREKNFYNNSRAKIASVVVGKGAVTLSGVLMGSFVGGLISGEFLSRIVSYIGLMGTKSVVILKRIIRGFSTTTFKSVALEYKNYPLYIFPSTILVQTASQIPIFFISRIYEAPLLGYYSLAISLLSIPVQIIGFSIGKVFFQKANELYADSPEKLPSRVVSLYYVILVLSAIGYGIVYEWGVPIFGVLAGENWFYAGKVASVLSFALIFQLTGIVLGPTLRVLGKEKAQLTINLISSIVVVFGLVLASYFNVVFDDFIIIVSMLISLRFIALIGIIFYLNKSMHFKHVILTILVVSLIFSFYTFIDYLIQVLI